MPSLTLGAPVACNGAFNAVASPNGTGNNFLVSTSAINVNDVWAVGNSTNASGYDQTLVEHWDGNSWSIVPSINPGSFHNDLNGVVAISSNDVWAVGDYTNDSVGSTDVPFAQHWNGSSWNWFALRPYPTNLFSFLTAVTATSSNDVWAVGTYYSAGYLPYVEHWDGFSWTPTRISYPNGGDSQLFAVSAWSPTDVWAVGEFGALQSWAVHWNGTAWSTITTPNTTGLNLIRGVNALEANHAVGVGFGNFISGTSPRQSQAWDLVATGTSTVAVISGSGLGTGDNALLGVSRSGGGLQAVGYWRSLPTSPRQTLVIPAAWDSVGHMLTWAAPGISASPGAVNNAFYSTTALSPQAFWATGYGDNTGVAQTLTELYCAHVVITGPAPTYVGAPFSLTVTAQNPNATTMTGYRGTIHFASSDPAATLPPDYTFTAADAGMHVFTGVVLNTTGTVTVTASDPVTSYVIGAAAFTVTCLGACPGPGGTIGARDSNPGPAGVAGSRDAIQSGAATAGPRLPRLGGLVFSGDTQSGAAPATAMIPAATAGGAAMISASTPQAASAIAVASPEGEVAALAASEPAIAQTPTGADMMAASRAPLKKVENSPGYAPLILIPLAIMSLALLVVRRQRNRRLIGHTRT